MKSIQAKLLFILFVLIPLVCQNYIYAGIHSYKSYSVLSNGKFVKIRIQESGVYKLTYEDLNAMGITPANVRIFGYGGAVLKQNFQLQKYDDLPELAIYMDKGNDGIFNAGDFILFYAQGVNSWSYDTGKAMFTHVINSYSSYGYYFVTSDAGEGKKIESVDIQLPSGAQSYDVNEFVDFKVHEKELISLASSGKEFYGETFSDVLSLKLNFTFPNIIKTSNAVKIRFDVAANSSEVSSFNLSFNDQAPKNLSVAKRTENDHYEMGRGATGLYSFTPDADLVRLKIDYNKPNGTAKGYLNYVEINAKRTLTLDGGVMRFQYPDYLGSDSYSKFTVKNVTQNVQIWDITDQINIKKINADINANELSFYSKNNTLKSYLAIDPMSSAFAKPEIVGTVPNQNLHGLPQTDMIIITHPKFIDQAKRLAKFHNERGEITVEVVTTEQVYNEFSSGTPDATAYRWLMKMFYDRAIASGNLSTKPKNLLLFGRGSYDNRKILFNSGDSYVLTYQAEHSLNETLSYVTDDYFTFLEDHEGDQVSAHSMDIGVGRFPVQTVQEATDVVTKTINYMKNENRGIWKNQICYLADDGDGALHMKQADSIASMVGRANPSFQITKIYLDAYQQEINASGETYPIARTQFHNLLRNGMFLLDFIGHAGTTGWTNEQILSIADVKNLSNKNLPLWVAATCNFLQFDLPAVSAGEHVLLNPVGGGIGIVSATRPVYASQNMNINKWINYYLFYKENGKYLSVGEVIARAKNTLGNETNKLPYVYMGDPSLKLNYPTTYNIVTEKINNKNAVLNDTLRALSKANFKGYIADADGKLIENFNGTLSAAVFDKKETIVTLNNDKSGGFTYQDRPSKLFSGLTEVVDGRFEIDFMLPKDIKYNYGSGRINYYATRDNNGEEAQGFYETFKVGGSNPNPIYDEEGPQLSIYLNSTDFKSGDKVNETPVFIATMKDENGINQAGSGIDHNLMLLIDNDPLQTFILNDYYRSAHNDYTQGSLTYKLPMLKTGKHTLTFKAWDLVNNSSEKTIEFEVVRGLEPQIFNVLNYPNPVKQSTRFVVEHDRPEAVLKFQLDIFDLSGRQVWSLTQSALNEIVWDVTDSTGQKLPAGVYLYRVLINSDKGSITSKVNKLIVVE
ncbi:type IX secretion system sortase PorU [Paludibacter sp.]